MTRKQIERKILDWLILQKTAGEYVDDAVHEREAPRQICLDGHFDFEPLIQSLLEDQEKK